MFAGKFVSRRTRVEACDLCFDRLVQKMIYFDRLDPGSICFDKLSICRLCSTEEEHFDQIRQRKNVSNVSIKE